MENSYDPIIADVEIIKMQNISKAFERMVKMM